LQLDFFGVGWAYRKLLRDIANFANGHATGAGADFD
jgi:hypothetical protein